jgi:tetratricopeptide (TPR) repeat protein
MLGARLHLACFVTLLYADLCCPANAQQPAPAGQIQQQVKTGDAAFSHGDYALARQSFEKAWQLAQRLPPKVHVRYQILKRLTATSVASGQFAGAQRYLLRAIEWRESNLGPKNPKIIDDLLLSINLDLRTKDFDSALATAQRIQAMHTTAYTADSLPVADDLLRIGQIHMAEGKSQEALHVLSEANNLGMKLAGPLDPGLLPVLDQSGAAIRAIEGGPGTGAESLYRQALMIRETLYGEDSTELISTLEWLADAYNAGGEYDRAEPLYERMLSLWERLVGKDHPMVALKLDKLAAFYSKVGKPEKAREALERSSIIRARFLAVGLAHQAEGAASDGHRDEARALYTRALVALGPPSAVNEDLVAPIQKALADIQKPAPQ